jgi:hypothetical protein
MMKKIAILMVLCLVVAGGATWFLAPKGKLIARAVRTDRHGFKHFVTVKQFDGRFNTQLAEEGQRELPVSMYEFYEGSDPIKAATIDWQTLDKFAVTFDNGIVLDCSWSQTKVVWKIH